MRPLIVVVAGAALCVVAVAGCSSAQQAANGPAGPGGPLAGKSIPVSVTTIDQGIVTRVMVQVSIGGGPTIPVMLDTGSQGLRVFADAAGAAGVAPTQTPVTETFASGVRLNGVVANAPVVVGGLPTAGPIPIMMIQSVDCDPSVSFCQPQEATAAFVAADNFGARGILGIGRMYGQQGVFSPILQLEGGVPTSYSLHLTEDGAGQIVFGRPPSSALATWAAPPDATPQQNNGVNAWNDEAVPACWSFAGTAATCVPTSFDSGNPSMNVAEGLPGAPPAGADNVLPAGVTVGLAASSGTSPFKSLTSGMSNDDRVESHPAAGVSQVNTGWAWFQLLTVSYDTASGQVSVA